MRGILIIATLLIGACAGARPLFPSGTPTPAPDAVTHWTEATEACRGARLYSAEITVDGTVGAERVRHQILQGAMTSDGRVRLLAVAPAGPPIFIMAGADAGATLTLPREQRVVRAPAPDMLDALIGLRLTNAEWLAMLSGCVSRGEARDGWRIGRATIVQLADRETRVRLDQDGRTWRVVAGERPDMLVEYEHFVGRWPSGLRLTSRVGAHVSVSLSMTISQTNVNIDLPDRAFALDVPMHFQPMTLEELRAIGPLGDRQARSAQ